MSVESVDMCMCVRYTGEYDTGYPKAPVPPRSAHTRTPQQLHSDSAFVGQLSTRCSFTFAPCLFEEKFVIPFFCILSFHFILKIETLNRKDDVEITPLGLYVLWKSPFLAKPPTNKEWTNH